MGILTDKQIAQLLNNNKLDVEKDDKIPVALITISKLRYSWLISELEDDNHDIAYGLTDLGDGRPKLGTIRLNDIYSLIHGDNYVFNDYTFDTQYPLGVFAMMSDQAKEMVADETGIEKAFYIASLKYNAE